MLTFPGNDTTGMSHYLQLISTALSKDISGVNLFVCKVVYWESKTLMQGIIKGHLHTIICCLRQHYVTKQNMNYHITSNNFLKYTNKST